MLYARTTSTIRDFWSSERSGGDVRRTSYTLPPTSIRLCLQVLQRPVFIRYTVCLDFFRKVASNSKSRLKNERY